VKTFQFNIAGKIDFMRARDLKDARRKIFFGEMGRVGKCDINNIDIKEVNDPRSIRLPGEIRRKYAAG